MEKLLLEKLISDGKSKDDIVSITGVKKENLYYWLKKFGLSIPKESNRKIFFDEYFFQNIDTEEKAYFFGFLSADGFIDKKGKTLTITLAEKDVHILEDLSKAIRFSGDIKDSKRNRKTIYFCSKTLVSSLKEKGITNNKTFTLEFPSLEKDMMRHYLRGYFDGDGYIGERQSVLSVASDNYKDSLMIWLKDNGFSEPSTKYQHNCHGIVFNRRNSDFLKYIYNDCNVYLKRKKKMFDDNWKLYESSRSVG